MRLETRKDFVRDVGLRVFTESYQGGRKYMEDRHCVAYQDMAQLDESDSKRGIKYIYLGIFDGHGGKEASQYTSENLLAHIVSQRGFWSKNDDDVLDAIKEGFVATHYAMLKEIGKWPKTSMGLPSTSGTTASVCFIMNNKYYIGHVGDSRIILLKEDKGLNLKSVALTVDHKPDSPCEHDRIINAGGKVVNKAGVERVVWNRPKFGHKGPVRRSTHFDEIPFLAVARSLGDLWSYNSSTNTFIVSPVPDVTVVPISGEDVCIILASDGLWNMVSESEVELLLRNVHESSGNFSFDEQILNPAKKLLQCSLQLWNSHNLRSDNISIITAFLGERCENNLKCDFINMNEFSSLKPTLVSMSACGEYIIDLHNCPRFANIIDENRSMDSEFTNIPLDHAMTKCEFTHVKSRSSLQDEFYSPFHACDISTPLQVINDNESNCKLTEGKIEVTLEGNKSDVSPKKMSIFDIVNESENINEKSGSGNEIVDDSILGCSRKSSASPKRNVHSDSYNSEKSANRRWRRVSNSPPAKRLRSSNWSRAKVRLPSILTRALEDSLLTRSRLRAIKCTTEEK